jgi:hypothetical protein
VFRNSGYESRAFVSGDKATGIDHILISFYCEFLQGINCFPAYGTPKVNVRELTVVWKREYIIEGSNEE